jgi:hypothetical protein
LLHDAADLARSNPGLFIAGSIAIGFGLSRFLKAGTAAAATVSAEHDPAAGATSTPPPADYGAQRPYESSVPSSAHANPGLATGITPTSPSDSDHPADFAAASVPHAPDAKGEL